MSRAGVLVVLALLLSGVGAGALSVVAVLSAPGPEVVAPAPDEVVPAPSDRDILRAAAIGSRVSVQRDASGGLIMVLPGSYDARTVEQVVPVPVGLPAGTAWLLAAGAAVSVAAAALRVGGRLAGGAAALATGVLAATGVVVLLAGNAGSGTGGAVVLAGAAVPGGAVAAWALGCAALAAVGTRAQAFSR